MSKRRWGHQVLIGIDQFINTIFAGYADETLSARAWRCRNKNMKWKIAHQIIDGLFFWQEKHCEKAYLNEVYRTQYPQGYQEGE